MSALAFLDNYQRIRQQFYKPQPTLVLVEEPKKEKIKARYVYMAPIGPIRNRLVLDAADYAERMNKVLFSKQKADGIIALVSDKYNLSKVDLLSERRTRNLVTARQELYYRLATEMAWSYPRIGKYLGGRDHTTILHGKRKFEERLMLGEVTL